MTAQRLVTALLDEGEDPKDFLRRMAPRSQLPAEDEVEYELEAEWEQEDPANHFEFPEDIEFARNAIRNDNVWGWCSTHVIAKWTTPEGEEVEGDDWLGGCSYHSRADFMQPGGYYDDMKHEAYEALCKELERRGYR